MSGPCNLCVLNKLKKRKPSGKRIRVVADKDSGMGGFNVYEYFAGETIDHKSHFVAWLMEIPERCEC